MIEVKNLTKTFKNNTALKNISFNIEKGKTTVIMGGSGSGKSTLLRIMSGLESKTSGEIFFEGKKISEKEIYKFRKKMSMVFQYSALLSSLNIFENVSFPLKEHTNLPDKKIEEKVKNTLSKVGLVGYENSSPSELSGGMQKRVSFARAIISDPEIVFFDEPTSGLDPIASGVIGKLIKNFKTTSVLVTHDVELGLNVADNIILMWQGEIIAEGTPNKIKNSKDPRIIQFTKGLPDGPISFSNVKGEEYWISQGTLEKNALG